jgi:hypothetical protein
MKGGDSSLSAIPAERALQNATVRRSIQRAPGRLFGKVIQEAAAVQFLQQGYDPGDTHTLSMWQSDSTVILCERYFSATVLRSNGVTKITGYS